MPGQLPAHLPFPHLAKPLRPQTGVGIWVCCVVVAVNVERSVRHGVTETAPTVATHEHASLHPTCADVWFRKTTPMRTVLVRWAQMDVLDAAGTNVADHPKENAQLASGSRSAASGNRLQTCRSYNVKIAASNASNAAPTTLNNLPSPICRSTLAVRKRSPRFDGVQACMNAMQTMLSTSRGGFS